MFNGLVSLAELVLEKNEIEIIKPGTIDNLQSLRRLNIAQNRVTTLDENLFDQQTRPIQLTISYSGITTDLPWQCETLCWLKEKEMSGAITWFNGDFLPECANGLDWGRLDPSDPAQCTSP